MAALPRIPQVYQKKPIGPRTGETKTAEYTKLNPRQKIPLLQDNELTLGESAAIVAYLARRYGKEENALIPADPILYAKWLEWCFFIVTELDSTSLYVMRRHGTVKGLGHLYGHAPEVVQKAGEYFRNQLRNLEETEKEPVEPLTDAWRNTPTSNRGELVSLWYGVVNAL